MFLKWQHLLAVWVSSMILLQAFSVVIYIFKSILFRVSTKTYKKVPQLHISVVIFISSYFFAFMYIRVGMHPQNIRLHSEQAPTAKHQYLSNNAGCSSYCYKIPCCEITFPYLHICLKMALKLSFVCVFVLCLCQFL